MCMMRGGMCSVQILGATHWFAWRSSMSRRTPFSCSFAAVYRTGFARFIPLGSPFPSSLIDLRVFLATEEQTICHEGANSDVPGSTVARRAHPRPPLASRYGTWATLYYVIVSDNPIPAQWNLLLNWIRESYFQCDSSLNYRWICFITLAFCCLRSIGPHGSLKSLCKWGAVKWTVYTLLREGVIKSV